MNSYKLPHFFCICVYRVSPVLHRVEVCLFGKIVEHIHVTKQFEILIWRQNRLVVARILHKNLHARHPYRHFSNSMPSLYAYFQFPLPVEQVLLISLHYAICLSLTSTGRKLSVGSDWRGPSVQRLPGLHGQACLKASLL